MAQRTDTELRVFLEGTLAQYTALTDKTGTVFFDKDNHAVYAKGECIIQSNIKDVTYNSTSTELTITPFTGTPIVINLGIQSELEGLETTLKTWVGNNYVTQTTFNTEIAKKVDKDGNKVLSTNDYTNDDKAKLAGIAEGAQVNVVNEVQGGTTSDDYAPMTSKTLSLSGNLLASSETDIIGGTFEYSLSHRYDSADNLIRFFNTNKAPTTGTSGQIFTIDTTDFIKDSFVDNVTFDPNTKTLTIIFNTESGKNSIPIDLSTLVDTYKEGFGIELGNDNEINVNYGAGLAIDTNQELVVKLYTDGGLKMVTHQLAVDWTKAPLRTVNGETIEDGNVDTTPKVWSF